MDKLDIEVSEHKQDTPNTSEHTPNLSPLLTKWQLKWKTPHWCGLIFFNFSMVVLLVIERIMTAKSVDIGGTWKVVLVGAVFPLLLTFLLYYMYKTIKNHKEYNAIIKPGRIKYFRIGFSSSFTSAMLTLVGLITSIHVQSIVTSVVVFTFIGIGCILGLVSSIFTSMYGFCATFDVFYHKNKEEIIREYLELHRKNQEEVKEGAHAEEEGDDSFKIEKEYPDKLDELELKVQGDSDKLG